MNYVSGSVAWTGTTWFGYAWETTVSAAGKIKLGSVTGRLTNTSSSTIGSGSTCAFSISLEKNNRSIYSMSTTLVTYSSCASGTSVSATADKNIDYEFSIDAVDTIRVTVGSNTQSWSITNLDYSFALAYYNPTYYKLNGLNIEISRTASPVGGSIGTLSIGDIIYSSDTLKFIYSVKDGYYIYNTNIQFRGVKSDGTVTYASITSGSTITPTTYSYKTGLIAASVLVYQYTATLDNQSSEKATAYLNRTSSPKQGAATGAISSGDAVYHGDIIKVVYTTVEGYAASISPSEEETVTDDLAFVITAYPLANMRVYRNGKWVEYMIYVGDGENWNLSQANIMRNGEWKVYS